MYWTYSNNGDSFNRIIEAFRLVLCVTRHCFVDEGFTLGKVVCKKCLFRLRSNSDLYNTLLYILDFLQDAVLIVSAYSSATVLKAELHILSPYLTQGGSNPPKDEILSDIGHKM